MSLPADISKLLNTREPASLGPGPRPGTESAADIEALVARCVVPESRRDLLRAALLLWHDHLDAAHAIVQEKDSADGSYLHAILHRREPDYANAKYWFRRVGRHRCYEELAARVATFLKSAPGVARAGAILPDGKWDALDFIDLCEAAAGKSDGEATALREIQRIEFEVLLEHLCSAP